MGFLDSLITKTESVPNNGEYIYNLDMVWKPGYSEHIPVSPGIIVINVKKLENNSFTFNIKADDTNTLYRTNYGWAFIENAPDNILLYNEQLRIDKEIQCLKLQRKENFNRMVHLGH
jgi:hypothetical protein